MSAQVAFGEKGVGFNSKIFQIFIGKRFSIFNSDHIAEIALIFRDMEEVLNLPQLLSWDQFNILKNRSAGLEILTKNCLNHAFRELMASYISCGLIDIIGAEKTTKNLTDLVASKNIKIQAIARRNLSYFLKIKDEEKTIESIADSEVNWAEIARKNPDLEIVRQNGALVINSKSKWQSEESAKLLMDLVGITQPYGNFREDEEDCEYSEEKFRKPRGLVLYEPAIVYKYHDIIEGRERLISLGQIYDKILFGVELRKAIMRESATEAYDSTIGGFFDNRVFSVEVADSLKKMLRESKTLFLEMLSKNRGIGFDSFIDLCTAINSGKLPQIIAESLGIEPQEVSTYENIITITSRKRIDLSNLPKISGLDFVKLGETNNFEVRINNVLQFEEVGLQQFREWSRYEEFEASVAMELGRVAHFDDIFGNYEADKMKEALEIKAKEEAKIKEKERSEKEFGEQQRKMVKDFLTGLKKILAEKFDVKYVAEIDKAIKKNGKVDLVKQVIVDRYVLEYLATREAKSSISLNENSLQLDLNNAGKLEKELRIFAEFSNRFPKWRKARELDIAKAKEVLQKKVEVVTASRFVEKPVENIVEKRVTRKVREEKVIDEEKRDARRTEVVLEVLDKMIVNLEEDEKRLQKKREDLNRRVQNICRSINEDRFYGEGHDRGSFLNNLVKRKGLFCDIVASFSSCKKPFYVHGSAAYGYSPKDIDFEMVFSDAEFAELVKDISNLGRTKEETSKIAFEKVAAFIPEEFRDIAKVEAIFYRNKVSLISIKIGDEIDVTLIGDSTRRSASNWTNEIDARCFLYDAETKDFVFEHKPSFASEGYTSLNCNAKDFYLRIIYSAVMPFVMDEELNWAILEEAKSSLHSNIIKDGLETTLRNISNFKTKHKIGKYFPEEGEIFDRNLGIIFQKLEKEKLLPKTEIASTNHEVLCAGAGSVMATRSSV